MEGILGEAEQILPDLLTSSYFTRSTPIDELFFGRTTSEKMFLMIIPPKKKGCFPLSPPFQPLPPSTPC